MDILTSELILSIGAHRTTLRPPGIAIEPNVRTRFGLATHYLKVSAAAALGEYSRIDRRLLLHTLLAKSLACGPRLQPTLVTHFPNASIHPLPAIAVFQTRLASCLHLLLSLLLHHFALLPSLELEIAATLILLSGPLLHLLLTLLLPRLTLLILLSCPLLHLLLASGLHLLLTLLLPRLTLLVLLSCPLLHLLLASGLHLLLTLLPPSLTLLVLLLQLLLTGSLHLLLTLLLPLLTLLVLLCGTLLHLLLASGLHLLLLLLALLHRLALAAVTATLHLLRLTATAVLSAAVAPAL